MSKTFKADELDSEKVFEINLKVFAKEGYLQQPEKNHPVMCLVANLSTTHYKL